MLASLFAEHLRIQQHRTDEALQRCGFDSIAFYAGGLHTAFLDDRTYPFKLNPHFALWTPLAAPIDCWVTYQPGRPLQLLFLQPIDYWHQPPETPVDYWTDAFEIKPIRTREEARAHVQRLPRCAFVGEWREEFTDWGFTEANPAALLNRLHFNRAVKTPYEIECIRRASLRAANGHRAAERAFRDGASEYAIHLAYLNATEHTESELPYDSIVALDQHAAVLHYQHYDRTAPTLHRSFLIDAGAQFAGYAADITRTYTHADDEFRALILRMDELQQSLCTQIRPGVDYTSVHLSAHLHIAQLLYDAELIGLNAEHAVECGLSSVFFPHGVGHLLGLQVHDVGGFMLDAQGTSRAAPAEHRYLRLTRTLQPGFVVTVEPGLYFIDALLEEARRGPLNEHIIWPNVERLRDYGGIRIEDDVLCTAGEAENLTRPAFDQVARG